MTALATASGEDFGGATSTTSGCCSVPDSAARDPVFSIAAQRLAAELEPSQV